MCSSFESKMIHLSPSTNLHPSVLSQGTAAVVAFVSCLLLLHILKISVRLLETVMDY